MSFELYWDVNFVIFFHNQRGYGADGTKRVKNTKNKWALCIIFVLSSSTIFVSQRLCN